MKLSEFYQTNDKATKMLKTKLIDFNTFCNLRENCDRCKYGKDNSISDCVLAYIKDDDCEIK